VRSVVQELYEEGNAVIIGRGSQYILKDYVNAWHILLVGDLEYRTRFVMNKYNLSKNESQKAIAKRDQIRSRFLGFFSDDGSPDDPLLYDLIIKMSRISMDKAEQLIVDLIS
jgi:cytidylate kinase